MVHVQDTIEKLQEAVRNLQQREYDLKNALHIAKAALVHIQNFNPANASREQNPKLFAQRALGQIKF